MQFEALEKISAEELGGRHDRCRRMLDAMAPEAGGLLVFSKVGMYYLCGTMVAGALWLPKQGDPVLMVRRGVHRAKLESPLEHIVPFRSFGDLEHLAAEAGSPLTPTIATEKCGISWNLAQVLEGKLSGATFVSGDVVMAAAQAVKSPWELHKMALAGKRHHQCVREVLPQRLKPGMTEREISHLVWQLFFAAGHCGIMRMGTYGEEIFLGHVSAGDSGNYPSTFNGPLGLRGEHPAATFMGYAGKVWRLGEPLAVDAGFCLEGYHTDRTQLYWAGTSMSVPDEVRRAQDFCLRVQQWLAENLKPGSVPSQLHAHCIEWAKSEGWEEGFMGLGQNKVKFLGHGIGLVIDGYPVIARGFDAPLEENMTLAIEPKIGLEGLGMVGVENTYAVTPTGGQCLTGSSFDMVCIA